jgi:hypothetical protein
MNGSAGASPSQIMLRSASRSFSLGLVLETYIGMPVIACVVLPNWVREHIEAKTSNV